MGLLYLPLIAIRPPPLSIETLPSGEIHAILPKGKKESKVKQLKGSKYTSIYIQKSKYFGQAFVNMASKGGVRDAKCWANVKEVQFSNLAMSMRR